LRPFARTRVRGCCAALLMLAVAAAGNLNVPAQTGAPPPAPNAPGGDAQPTLSTTNPALQLQITTNAPPTDAQTSTNAAVTPSAVAPEPVTVASTNVFSGTAGANGLTMIFRNAPLSQVFTYLMDVAGFVVDEQTRVSGTITVQGKEMTRDEVVAVLSSALNRNGYGIIREGRTLKIINQSDAPQSATPVRIGNIATNIPKNAEIVTQVIPVNFVEARQLTTDLSPMIGPHATIIANEAGNEIIVTDTQENIRHLVEIIQAIDSSAETGTEIRVFQLIYHDPQEVSDILNSLFSNQNNSGSQSPLTFNARGGGRGGGGRGGGGFGGGAFGGGRGGGAFGGPGGFLAALTGANAGGNNQADRIKKRDQVVVTPDERTGQVVVMASRDLIVQIADMIKELDIPSDKLTKVTTVAINFGDAQQIQQVLQNMFPNNNARNNNANVNSILTQRQTQQQNSSTATGMGTIGTGGRGGGLP
jgi:type II secretory pathway component GspD/PulD (secretin)